MKLFSAAGLDDLTKGYSYTQYAKNFVGATDLISYCENNGYAPTQTAKGLNVRQYMNTLALPLRDIVDDGSAAEWIALGLMIEPTVGQSFPTSSNAWFTLTTDAYTSAAPFTSGRTTVLNDWGGGVRHCQELLFKPSTGQWNLYVNGVLRASGTISMDPSWLVPSNLRQWYLNFCAYTTNSSSGYFTLTDFYLAKVDSGASVLGNFKVSKLVTKQTTLPAAAATIDGNTATLTGNYSVEFDVTSLDGKSVQGVVESVRACSVGPTAALSATRRLNGADGAANKVTNIALALPSGQANFAQHYRLGAKATEFTPGTPVTEFKVNLSVVDNT